MPELVEAVVTKLEELAVEYRDACSRVRPSWASIMACATGSPERTAAVRAYNACCNAVLLAKARLLEYARGEHSEVGC